MVNNTETRPARRPQGSLSARQWQEIRQAARLARSEGVEITRFGFTIRPAPDSKHTVRGVEPHEARGATQSQQSSTSQSSSRNAKRALEFQERMRLQKLWLPLTRRLLRKHRKESRDALWTSWLRARLSHRSEVQRKLRDLLWRAWTLPQFGSSSGNQDLSHRDKYRRASFRGACALMSVRITAVIQAQDEILSTCPEPDRPSLPTRGVDEAGLTTPASARRGKKSRGRGSRGP